MQKQSAGILLFRRMNKAVEFFLVHPGGPFWAKKDLGAWSIPKGEFVEGEVALDAAIREFKEETGYALKGNFIPLTPRKQKSGKLIHAWALQHNVDEEKIVSNDFEMEWPPRSGKMKAFPEVDRAGWFEMEEAQHKIIPGQKGFLEELALKL
jgi:predicted NUDIX family NTP pyrophosphohydrolase